VLTRIRRRSEVNARHSPLVLLCTLFVRETRCGKGARATCETQRSFQLAHRSSLEVVVRDPREVAPFSVSADCDERLGYYCMQASSLIVSQ
jgi:hypothetical protein